MLPRAKCVRKWLSDTIFFSNVTSYLLKKGQDFTTDVNKLETDLMQEMIASSRSWENEKFKPSWIPADLPRDGVEVF